MNLRCTFGLLSLFMLPSVFACGPTPQKVVETIEIHAPVNAVLEVLKHPELMPRWHPMVEKVATTPALSLSEGASPEQRRELMLRNGQTLHERLRQPGKPTVVEDSLMAGGNFPMSQYRGVLEVRPSDKGDVVTLVWSARFNNQANLLDAPAGQDNATAIAAVTAFYLKGLQGLKHYLETSPDQYSYHTPQTKEN